MFLGLLVKWCLHVHLCALLCEIISLTMSQSKLHKHYLLHYVDAVICLHFSLRGLLMFMSNLVSEEMETILERLETF